MIEMFTNPPMKVISEETFAAVIEVVIQMWVNGKVYQKKFTNGQQNVKYHIAQNFDGGKF